MTTKLCARNGCTEPVFPWLDKEHCTAECEAESRREKRQQREAEVLTELVRDIDAILARAYADERRAA